MDFDALFANVCEALQREQRISYRALRRRFELSDDDLEDLKIEIIEAKRLAVDENDRILVWIGETETTPAPAPTPTAQPGITQEMQPAQVESPPTATHVPDAERRQLTVMFCDLVDSTSLSGELDPEDLRDVVRAYQTACSEVIERYDGHIAQHLGDGLLVYFGYPQAHEDDAQRAVYTGLGILATMWQLNERLQQANGVHLAVRIGIHTGLVVVGDIGEGSRQEQLALGETPNIAARIQALAAPDTVVISAETYRLAQGYFDCESLGEHDLRGVSQAVAVYRVIQESGAQSRLDIAGIRSLMPLIGRESETTLLFERWEQAKGGNGQVVLLSGEAGIGKSRLVQVLKDHVAEDIHTRLECRSLPYFTNSTLYPITDFLQRMLRFQVDDTPEKKLEKLKENLSQYRLPLEETVPLFGNLLSLPVPEDRYASLNLSPQRQRQRTLEAIVAIVLELSERQPLLFILEDLHWTDPTTLELLNLLVDQVPTASMYVLLASRPEYQPTWSRRSYLTEVTVNRLSGNQIERMAAQVAAGKGLPVQVVNQIVEKTDGVPLYVEEMTKAVLESGVLKETEDRYELEGSIASLTIPATLQDSLMSRLDRLVTAKGIAQCASVIGRQFSYEILQAVSGLDEATLRRELSRLVEAELVYQRGMPPHATYIFKHALVQDIAYESLLRGTRQGYHRCIAEVLTEQYPETAQTQPELLAYHATEAGLHIQAVRYWHQAGQRAVARSANVEAVSHLNRGLELLKVLPDTPEHVQHELDFQIALGPALMATKGFASPEVGSTYARARELCQHVENTPQLFSVLVGLRAFYLNRGELKTAYELAEQLFALAQHYPDPVHLVEAHRALGTTLSSFGEFSQARKHLEQVITLYNDQQRHAPLLLSGAGDPGVICLSRMAEVLWFLGFPEQSLERSHESCTLARKLSHSFNLIRALGYAVRLHQLRREDQSVQELIEVLQGLHTETGSGFDAVGISLMGDWALAMQDATEQGIVPMQQSLTAYRTTGQRLMQPYYLALLAEAHRKAGRFAEGLIALTEGLNLAEKSDERFNKAELHRLQGELLLQQSPDNAADAETCFQQAITIAQNQSAKSWELRAATSLARLWQSQSKRKEAYDLLAPVYGWFTEGFDTADLKDAKTLLAELS